MKGERTPEMKKTKVKSLNLNEITFREYPRPTDVERVRDIVRSSDFFSEHETGVAMELVEERLQKGPTSGYHFLFAEKGDLLLGYACFAIWASLILLWSLRHIEIKVFSPIAFFLTALLTPIVGRVAEQTGIQIPEAPVAIFCHLVTIAVIALPIWAARRARKLAEAESKWGPRCSTCNYYLRGLDQPRCPECGTPFDPAIMIEASNGETTENK